MIHQSLQQIKKVCDQKEKELGSRYCSLDMPNCEESWALKNWCFWTVVLEKTLESPLDCKEIQPVHPKGDQSWVFIGGTDAEAETPVLWPPHTKSWLIGKDSDAGRDWGQEEKGTTENEMAEWHHRLDGLIKNLYTCYNKEFSGLSFPSSVSYWTYRHIKLPSLFHIMLLAVFWIQPFLPAKLPSVLSCISHCSLTVLFGWDGYLYFCMYTSFFFKIRL